MTTRATALTIALVAVFFTKAKSPDTMKKPNTLTSRVPEARIRSPSMPSMVRLRADEGPVATSKAVVLKSMIVVTAPAPTPDVKERLISTDSVVVCRLSAAMRAV